MDANKPGGSSTVSMYGSGSQTEPPHPPITNVPVSKWRKQWVKCDGVMVHKWTRLSDEEAKADELKNKRRFRYIPIAALENRNTGSPQNGVSKEAAESSNILSNGIAKMTMAVGDASSQKLSVGEASTEVSHPAVTDASQKLKDGEASTEVSHPAVNDASQKLKDGEASTEKPSEDQSEVKNNGEGSASGANNCVLTSKMMIDWEDELMSSM